MIVFDLKCGGSHGGAHVFEAWFGSSAEYESQAARGLIACPMCGDTGVGKAVMAPAVAAKGNRGAVGRDLAAGAVATEAGDPHAALLAMQRRMEAESEYVGGAFAQRARALHDIGDHRAIYGEATIAEARELVDDGIAVMPLPFRPLVRSDA